jgi:hypothetical protein
MPLKMIKIDDVKDGFYEDLERGFDKFPTYHTKIVLGDFNAKVDRENIFKPKIDTKSLQAIGNNNGLRVVNFITPKISQPKIRCSHIATSINVLGRFQIGKPTIRLTVF